MFGINTVVNYTLNGFRVAPFSCTISVYLHNNPFTLKKKHIGRSQSNHCLRYIPALKRWF